MKNQQKKDEPQKTNAMVFTITRVDVDTNNSVVSGDIFVSGILTHALIDSGVTHSFASLTYVKRLGRSCEKFSEVFSTMLPSGEILYSTHWLRGVPICIDGRELYAGLTMLEMHDYEEILVMDWLSMYNATIDCRKKIVKRLLESGCMGYLASVVDTYKEQKLKPEDVPVVRDFLEVFPKDLPRLPLDKEIEFVIKLLPENVAFWGHIVSKDGISVDPAKIEDVSKWNRPRNVSEKELNMRQRRWLEVVKYYDCQILYLPGKANVVADALSRKSHGNVSFLRKLTRPLQEDMCRPEIEIPEWKWQEITVDFVVGLPKTSKQHDVIWVIVDRYTKSAHFLPTKEFVDRKRRDVEFNIGDKIFLKTAPMKGAMRFGKKGKLSPRFIGTFEVLEKVGKVAYRLALLPSLSNVHDIFHVSLLRKYVIDPSHVLNYEPIEVEQDLTYEEN
ncbi:uncharacterized protein LOC133814627 [Humulus lupulus]|uniref:uncharacterized protein LOC133814627 n=1 Tax=Humulus lupulus TaxID=3486 RepID=UPI002B40A1CB|nr:uncharacterized protein LOC133814627 [Humulus lupulus]